MKHLLLSLWTRAFPIVLAIVLIHANATAQTRGDLPKLLQALEVETQNSSISVRSTLRLIETLPETEQWGYAADVQRFNESELNLKRQIAAAKSAQTPTNLYGLRVALGEHYMRLNTLALWTYLRGVRGTSGAKESHVSALLALNDAAIDLNTRIFLYDLEVRAILEKP